MFAVYMFIFAKFAATYVKYTAMCLLDLFDSSYVTASPL